MNQNAEMLITNNNNQDAYSEGELSGYHATRLTKPGDIDSDVCFCIPCSLFENQGYTFHYERYALISAYFWLVCNANEEKSNKYIKGMCVPVDRGQLLTTVSMLAVQFKWNPNAVERWLRKLQYEKLIHYFRRKEWILITVQNFDQIKISSENEPDDQFDE